MNTGQNYKYFSTAAVFLTLGLLVMAGCAQNPHYSKGQSLANRGQWEEAVVELKAAAKAEPQNTKYQRELAAAQKTLAKHYYSLGQKAFAYPKMDVPHIVQAKTYFQKTLENNPQFPGAKENWSRSILLEEALLKAREEAYTRAKEAQRQGDWSAAQKEFQKVLELDPAYTPARENFQFSEKMLSVEALLKEAQKAREQGDKKKAKELYQGAAAILPQYGPAQEAYRRLEQQEKKELAWQRLTLAQLLIKNQRWEEAQKLLEEAQLLDEQSPQIKNTLYALKIKRVESLTAQGDKLFAAKKFMEAITFYRGALKIVPDYKGAVDGMDFSVGALAETHYIRARAYQQKNLGGNAAAEFNICRQLVPHYKNAEELFALTWAKIKRSLPRPARGERRPGAGVGEVIDQKFIFLGKEWEDKGNKERAVEEYCRAMAQDERLNLWPKIFELKGFDPEKVKQALALDSLSEP